MIIKHKSSLNSKFINWQPLTSDLIKFENQIDAFNYNIILSYKKNNDTKSFFYKKEGNENYLHRLDGYAYTLKDSGFYFYGFYIDGIFNNYFEFSEKTNHLICISCNKFCKQQCF